MSFAAECYATREESALNVVLQHSKAADGDHYDPSSALMWQTENWYYWEIILHSNK